MIEEKVATLWKTSANERHERHHRHGSEQVAYLTGLLNDDKHDDGMTVAKPFVNPLSCENPLGIRKSTANDAHDGDDDELQRFSKCCDGPGYREYKADKGRRRCEVRPRYSAPNTSPLLS